MSSQTGSVAQLVRDQNDAMESVTDNAQQLETMAADLQSLTRELSVNEAVVSELSDDGADADPAAAGDD